jgi:hypothetical protein
MFVIVNCLDMENLDNIADMLREEGKDKQTVRTERLEKG